MKNSSFHLQLGPFVVSFLCGMIAFIIYILFSRTDRRDKIYSSLFGWLLSILVWILLFRFTDIRSILPPNALH